MAVAGPSRHTRVSMSLMQGSSTSSGNNSTNANAASNSNISNSNASNGTSSTNSQQRILPSSQNYYHNQNAHQSSTLTQSHHFPTDVQADRPIGYGAFGVVCLRGSSEQHFPVFTATNSPIKSTFSEYEYMVRVRIDVFNGVPPDQRDAKKEDNQKRFHRPAALLLLYTRFSNSIATESLKPATTAPVTSNFFQKRSEDSVSTKSMKAYRWKLDHGFSLQKPKVEKQQF
ncbi:hypothetical protein V9T40_000296 [Parthenolecanium corni]|uniref:Uncharacterized protein n=1 Tax=Parthenolecanium corni TaxID=536013 RepID=A0AAN9TM49_9HEMI